MNEKEENEVVTGVEEYCAVQKSIAVRQLDKLLKEYSNVFEEYNMWVAILNCQVNLIEEEKA